jgi:hypothetical protein
MSKISSIVLYILAGISIILAGVFFFGPTATVSGVEDVPLRFDINLAWAVVLFVLTVLITLFFSIEYLITHPKSLKGAAISLVSGIVLIGVAYLLASGAPIEGAKEPVSTKLSKWVDVGLIVTYILGGVAILAMLVSEIYRALK